MLLQVFWNPEVKPLGIIQTGVFAGWMPYHATILKH